MYIYALPLVPDQAQSQPPVAEIAGAHEDSPSPAASTSASAIPQQSSIPTPTSDGGLEHTTATFHHASTWLSLANPVAYPPHADSPAAAQNDDPIIMFPPQLFLLYLVSKFLPSPTTKPFSQEELVRQRESLLAFVRGGNPPWGNKCISPVHVGSLADGRTVLDLNHPGPELEGSDRRGDGERVVFVDFQKEGTRRVEVAWKKDAEGKLVSKGGGGKL